MTQSNSPSRIKNDSSITWHDTTIEIPYLNESEEALVLMHCHDWPLPLTGKCRIGWDGSYYVEWLINNEEVLDNIDSVEYFSPDYWAYVSLPK